MLVEPISVQLEGRGKWWPGRTRVAEYTGEGQARVTSSSEPGPVLFVAPFFTFPTRFTAKGY
jgi:hypothetical protein